jgi:mycothiol synthase
MEVVLVEMSPGEFAARRVELLRDSVASLAASRGLSVPEAEATAERNIAQALWRGAATPGQLVRTAVGDGGVVGWIWVSMSGIAVPGMAWICDIVVDPPFRRQGIGGAIIAAAERELVELGEARLGLNVYGHNATAIRLYERLGFDVIRQVRARSLADVPAHPTTSVDLVPMSAPALERRLAATEAAYPPEREVRRAAAGDGLTMRTALADGIEVGWVWYGRHGPDRPGMGWIYQLDVDEPHRSQGYGTAILAAAEADLVRHGVRSAGLFVRGDNVRAQRLYERLGFELMSQEMSKPLPAL